MPPSSIFDDKFLNAHRTHTYRVGTHCKTNFNATTAKSTILQNLLRILPGKKHILHPTTLRLFWNHKSGLVRIPFSMGVILPIPVDAFYWTILIGGGILYLILVWCRNMCWYLSMQLLSCGNCSVILAMYRNSICSILNLWKGISVWN